MHIQTKLNKQRSAINRKLDIEHRANHNLETFFDRLRIKREEGWDRVIKDFCRQYPRRSETQVEKLVKIAERIGVGMSMFGMDKMLEGRVYSTGQGRLAIEE